VLFAMPRAQLSTENNQPRGRKLKRKGPTKESLA
jgi:hypothetical protein